MSIETYRQEFLPLIDRKIVEAELTLNNNILTDVVEPTLAQLFPHIGKGKFKSEQLSKMETQFNRMVGQDPVGMFRVLHQKIQQLKDNLSLIEKLVKKHIPNSLASESMTYKQIALIRMIEVIGHVTNYTQQFIFYALSAENAKNSGERLDSLVNRATIRSVEEGFVGYCQILNRLVMKNAELEKMLDTTPDIIIAQSNEEVARTVHGTTKLDPIRSGFISTKYNPIFRFRIAWADYMARRYHIAKELLRAYEVQLAYLLQMKDNANDVNPVLEKRIEELTALIEEQKHALARMEARYA